MSSGSWPLDNKLRIVKATTTEFDIVNTREIKYLGGEGNLDIDNEGGSITFYNGAYRFPSSDGEQNMVMKTNGQGVLSWQSDSSSGEVNTMSSSGGMSIYKQKVMSDLVIKGLTATSNKITLTSNTNDIGIDVDQTQITGTGTLNSGSISSGFGDIDIGTNKVTAYELCTDVLKERTPGGHEIICDANLLINTNRHLHFLNNVVTSPFEQTITTLGNSRALYFLGSHDSSSTHSMFFGYYNPNTSLPVNRVQINNFSGNMIKEGTFYNKGDTFTDSGSKVRFTTSTTDYYIAVESNEWKFQGRNANNGVSRYVFGHNNNPDLVIENSVSSSYQPSLQLGTQKIFDNNTTLSSTVVNSSLTSLGTITSLQCNNFNCDNVNINNNTISTTGTNQDMVIVANGTGRLQLASGTNLDMNGNNIINAGSINIAKSFQIGGEEVQTNSTSYVISHAFVYGGSNTDGTISTCKAICRSSSGVNGMAIRLYDQTNSTLMGQVTNILNTTNTIINIPVSNVPTGEAILTIQITQASGSETAFTYGCKIN